MLHKQRERWEMRFVLGARPGLEEIERTTFDVVVSDMRMPEVSGVELLRHVRDRDPTTIRMVLSGYHEMRPASHLAPVVHHFLDKPCLPSHLFAMLEKACAVRARCVNEPLQALVGRIAALPSGVVDAAIAHVIEQVPTLAPRILMIGRVAAPLDDAPVTTVADALSRLGLDSIMGYAFATGSEVAGATLIRDISTTMIALAMPEHDLIGTTRTELGAYWLTRWSLPLETIESLAQGTPQVASAMQAVDAQLVCDVR